MLQNELYQKVFNSSVDEAPQVLKAITNKYPWFSLAHYFNLKANPGDEILKRKASIHFNNDLLLHLRLSQLTVNTVVENVVPEETIEEIKETIVEEKVEEPNIISQLVAKREESEPKVVEEVIVEEEVIESIGESEPVGPIEPVTDNEAKTAEPAKEDTLLFEPLHTTDYFASQGIKLSEEIKSGDKLGKQMKSFTEWLKTMKKIPTANVEQIPIDKKVEEFAENSNKDLDIYTESLAEVYVSQGKTEKARDIYKKLILLNPDKSAYFAAKLDKL